MYVVQIIPDDDAPVDYKAFKSLHDAKQRYLAASRKVIDEEWKSVALFRTDNVDDARKAIAHVRAGNKSHVELMDLQEDLDTWVDKMDIKIEL